MEVSGNYDVGFSLLPPPEQSCVRLNARELDAEKFKLVKLSPFENGVVYCVVHGVESVFTSLFSPTNSESKVSCPEGISGDENTETFLALDYLLIDIRKLTGLIKENSVIELSIEERIKRICKSNLRWIAILTLFPWQVPSETSKEEMVNELPIGSQEFIERFKNEQKYHLQTGGSLVDGLQRLDSKELSEVEEEKIKSDLKDKIWRIALRIACDIVLNEHEIIGKAYDSIQKKKINKSEIDDLSGEDKAIELLEFLESTEEHQVNEQDNLSGEDKAIELLEFLEPTEEHQVDEIVLENRSNPLHGRVTSDAPTQPVSGVRMRRQRFQRNVQFLTLCALVGVVSYLAFAILKIYQSPQRDFN